MNLYQKKTYKMTFKQKQATPFSKDENQYLEKELILNDTVKFLLYSGFHITKKG